MDRRTLPDPRRFPFPPIIQDIGNILGIDVTGDAGNRFTPPPWIEAIVGDNAEAIVDQFGEEIVTMVMSDPVLASLAQAIGETVDAVEEAVDDVADAVGDAVDAAEEFVEEVVEEAEELVGEFIDTATDTASDAVNEVAGWFGL